MICEDRKLKCWNWEVWWIRFRFLDDADWRLYVRERSSQIPIGGEFGYKEHGAVEAQGSTGHGWSGWCYQKMRRSTSSRRRQYQICWRYCWICTKKTSTMNKVYFMRRLFNLQIFDGESIADHINEFNMIISQLRSVEINFEYEIKALVWCHLHRNCGKIIFSDPLQSKQVHD